MQNLPGLGGVQCCDSFSVKTCEVPGQNAFEKKKKGLRLLSSQPGIICTDGELIASGNVDSILCAHGTGEIKKKNKFWGFLCAKATHGL